MTEGLKMEFMRSSIIFFLIHRITVLKVITLETIKAPVAQAGKRSVLSVCEATISSSCYSAKTLAAVR